jgi:hypothetical protein
MKLKSKLILAASSLLVLSGVAAGTSTYAWFTANQKATVHFDEVGVHNNQGALKIAGSVATASGEGLTGGSATAADALTFTSAEKAAGDGLNKITDVSGNGINFFKADIVDGAVTSAAAVTTAFPYCYEMDLTFTTTNSSAQSVFLSYTSTISNATTKLATEPDIARCVRAAIVSGTSVRAYFCPNDTVATGASDNGYKYISAVSSTTVTYSEYSAMLATGYTQNVLDSTYVADATDATTATKSQKGYIGDITAGGSLEVKLIVWIEGNDADCVNVTSEGVDNGILSQTFNANFVFNGVSVINS